LVNHCPWRRLCGSRLPAKPVFLFARRAPPTARHTQEDTMRVDRRTFNLWAAAIVMAAAIAASAACGSGQPEQQAAPAPVPPAPKVTTGAERAAWYQECWAHFNNKAWDQFRACYGDAVESAHVGSGGPVARGVDAIVTAAKAFADAFPDAKGTGELILVNGDTLASIYTVSGIQTGPLAGPGGSSIPATNKRIGFLQAHLIQTDPATGKVVKEEFYSDSGTMMAQLGVSPGPARPPATSTTAAPRIAVASGSSAEAGNVATALAQIDSFNKHDVKGVMAFGAPDMIMREAAAPKDQTSSDGGSSVEAMFKAFPDAKLVPASSWGAGDYVTVLGRFEGTNKGAMAAMGIKKPTGRPVSVGYVEITRWESGKIKEDWLFYDGMAFAAQLGLIEAGPK
jgi:predicted ester cyclase